MAGSVRLHLVDNAGSDVSSVVRDSIEAAYRWVVVEYPNVDTALIANWAERLAGSMQLRGAEIEHPKRFAYAALSGRVRDWFRTRASQEIPVGADRDLERIGGSSRTFVNSIERKILFDQLLVELSERDRTILIYLLDGETSVTIAKNLGANAPAIRKSIERLKIRITAILAVKHRVCEEVPTVHLFKRKGQVL